MSPILDLRGNRLLAMHAAITLANQWGGRVTSRLVREDLAVLKIRIPIHRDGVIVGRDGVETPVKEGETFSVRITMAGHTTRRKAAPA